MATASGALQRGDPPAVEVENLTVAFGEEVVLYRLGLRVPPGGTTVVMGPSGAGKSTLVRAVLGLLQPETGAVRLGDVSVLTDPAERLRQARRGLGALLGGTSLFDASTFGSLTVHGNLAYPLEQLGVEPDLLLGRVDWWLRELDLADVADALPEELAGHTRRRMAIGRAMVADPPLVVLDEIDTGLDAPHRDAVVAAIRGAQRRTGATFLITTHDTALARDLGDHLAVLCNSRIVASGPPAELLAGVETGDDFEERFRLLDTLGPPSLAEALESEREARRRYVTFDPIVIIVFVVGSIMIVFLIAAIARFQSGGP